jgi:hypothetical protein
VSYIGRNWIAELPVVLACTMDPYLVIFGGMGVARRVLPSF